APRLPSARAGRSGRARDARPRRAGALRPGRGMGGQDRLHSGSAARRALLRGDPALLAGTAGGRARTGLRWHSPQDLGQGRTRGRLPRAGPARAWCVGPREPVRHRIARADCLATARRRGAQAIAVTATHLPPTAIPERRYGRPGRDRIAGKPDEVATGAVHFRPGAVTLFFS